MFKGKRRSREKKEKAKAKQKSTSPSERESEASAASSVSLGSSLRNSVLFSQESSDRSHGSHHSKSSPSLKSGGSFPGTGSEGSKTDANTTQRATSSSTTSGVRFAHVKIQEYERVIADNPSCSSGAPIGLGWAHTLERTMELDEYEASRVDKRGQLDLVLTRQDREELLLEWGATFQQIIEAIRTNIKVKNQRRRTVNNLGTYDRWEEAMESASRKLKRTVLMQKPARTAVEGTHANVPKGILKNAPVPVRRVSSTSRASQQGVSISVSHAGSSEHSQHTNNTFADMGNYPNRRRDVILEGDDDDDDADVLSYAPVMEVNVGESPQLISVIGHDDAQSYQLPPSPPSSSQGDSFDDFENLQRDASFWEMRQGADAPEIRRKMTPVVISEDADYYGINGLSDYDVAGDDLPGFSMQPPPYSNSIISQWE